MPLNKETKPSGGKMIGFILFRKVLTLCETQASRIWTRVPVIISNNSNHYTMNTSNAKI